MVIPGRIKTKGISISYYAYGLSTITENAFIKSLTNLPQTDTLFLTRIWHFLEVFDEVSLHRGVFYVPITHEDATMEAFHSA